MAVADLLVLEVTARLVTVGCILLRCLLQCDMRGCRLQRGVRGGGCEGVPACHPLLCHVVSDDADDAVLGLCHQLITKRVQGSHTYIRHGLTHGSLDAVQRMMPAVKLHRGGGSDVVSA